MNEHLQLLNATVRWLGRKLKQARSAREKREIAARLAVCRRECERLLT